MCFFRHLNGKVTEERTILTAQKQLIDTTVLKKQKYDLQCQVVVAGKYLKLIVLIFFLSMSKPQDF